MNRIFDEFFFKELYDIFLVIALFFKIFDPEILQL